MLAGPLYNLEKNAANTLKIYVKDDNNNAKNSTRFFSYTSNVPIEDDKMMVSFDITSMYTNTPTIDMLNIIKSTYVNNDDQFTRKVALRQDKVFDLVNLVLTTSFYTSNSQFYQETDGVQWKDQHFQPQQKSLNTPLNPSKFWEQFFGWRLFHPQMYTDRKPIPSHQQSLLKH